ncbi:EAL domain-containing protein (putative c-di-GMP-specific phosphodiesterase class I) [Streptomyces canus]|nr:EAL domain-containing protein (putative c-di-GMP-specific phosphodiesterase class I) [Streptomyces canus]
MRSWTDTLRFAFQPVANLATRGVAGLEILARPETGDILAEARRDPELGDQLVVLALRAAVRRETSLPLHVNVFAGTLAEAAVGGHDRRGTAYPHVPHQALLEALTELRGQASGSARTACGTGTYH